MAIAEVFDRVVYRCDKCTHVWLAMSAELPVRCANPHGRHKSWNDRDANGRMHKKARRFEAETFVRSVMVKQPVLETVVDTSYTQE